MYFGRLAYAVDTACRPLSDIFAGMSIALTTPKRQTCVIDLVCSKTMHVITLVTNICSIFALFTAGLNRM